MSADPSGVPNDNSASLSPEKVTGQQSGTGQPSQTLEVPRYSFEELAQGHVTIQLTFSGREYCLRRTKAGKLVLNK